MQDLTPILTGLCCTPWGGLQYSGLGIEALQFGIDKLQALQLRFGFV